MKRDYLWDQSGEPDPQLEKLEKALGQFRTSAEGPDFSAVRIEREESSRPGLLNWRPHRFFAASLVSAGLVTAALLLVLRTPLPPSGPRWDVSRLAGTPRVGRVELASESSKAQLRVGQVLVTDSNSRASINASEVGEVEIDSGSRVRLLEADSNRHRIALELGTIHAAIWAPPGEFQVDTPSAIAVDLGCAYTLHVEADGSGTIRTTMGWVGFHKDGRDSFIPAGAVCSTHPLHGPGTPYFEDASPAFCEALHNFDFSADSATARQEALRVILKEARPRDGFTLWHLLARVEESERPMVYGRLAALLHPPAGATRESTLALDPSALDAWWNAFELGDISVWRYWEQNQAPNFKVPPGTYKKAAR
jgi:hypothetical protein